MCLLGDREWIGCCQCEQGKVWQSDHSGNATVSMSWNNKRPFVFFACSRIDDDDPICAIRKYKYTNTQTQIQHRLGSHLDDDDHNDAIDENENYNDDDHDN